MCVCNVCTHKHSLEPCISLLEYLLCMSYESFSLLELANVTHPWDEEHPKFSEGSDIEIAQRKQCLAGIME